MLHRVSDHDVVRGDDGVQRVRVARFLASPAQAGIWRRCRRWGQIAVARRKIDPRHPDRSAFPDFGKSRNLIPARREALDHRLALFRQIVVPAANGLDG